MTLFIDNELVFGYKGNAVFAGTTKKTLLQFQTPLTPEGAIDLLDFSFRMATPAAYTLADATNMMIAMSVPDPRLARYGGGFVKNIDQFKSMLKHHWMEEMQHAQLDTLMVEAIAALERLNEIFRERPTVEEAENAVTLAPFSGTLCFDRVSFAYPDGARRSSSAPGSCGSAAASRPQRA